MQIKAQIPNLLTLSNLFCGVMAILYLLLTDAYGDPWIIAILMGAALVFDFLDGMVARLLKVSSPIGKELDSLADMVTFGVLPGILMYRMMAYGETKGEVFIPGLIALLIPVFSALRLAKFNVDERQSDRFFGLPTPANAVLMLSLFLIFCLDTGTLYRGWLTELPVLAAITVVFSILLVVDLPLLALKFKSFSFKDNAYRFILIGLSIVLGVILTYKAVPLIILLYILISIIENLNKPS